MKPCDQFVGSRKAGQCKNATPSTEPSSARRWAARNCGYGSRVLSLRASPVRGDHVAGVDP